MSDPTHQETLIGFDTADAAVIEKLVLPSFVFDRHRRIRWTNNAFRKLTGLGADVSGRPILDICPDLVIDRNGSSPIQVIETYILGISGEAHWLSLSFNIFARDRGPESYLAIGFPIIAQTEARRREEVIIRETQHRSRNMMSIVAAIASQTLGGEVAEAKLRQFVDRLRSLDASIRASCDVAEDRCPLFTVIRSVTSRFQAPDEARFQFKGEDVDVSAQIATKAALIVHELSTNSIKYGALSVRGGHVEILTCHAHTPDDSIVIEWRELGGPPVVPPGREGFGLALIDRLGAHGSCAAAVRFPATGVVCRLEFPVADG